MSDKPKRAQWGAQAHLDERGKLPVSFPRILGPNAMAYLQEVAEKIGRASCRERVLCVV